jgi:hypothetical protein
MGLIMLSKYVVPIFLVVASNAFAASDQKPDHLDYIQQIITESSDPDFQRGWHDYSGQIDWNAQGGVHVGGRWSTVGFKTSEWLR